MSRHRAEPPRRRVASPGPRHAPSKPRYGRLGVLGVSTSVCVVALLGGMGVLPSVADEGTNVARDLTGTSKDGKAGASAVLVLDSSKDQLSEEPARADETRGGTPGETPGETPTETPGEIAESDRPDPDASVDETLPADSGDGRRVVFSEARQRVWLVDEDGDVDRTYPVSGSLYDNLDPGSYEVYSRSEQAYAFDGSGSMKYFVRFAEGDTGAAIGFHDIPVDNSGDLVQDLDQLGTPQSHGCVRQERDDAIALWEFAPVGTEVVVV